MDPIKERIRKLLDLASNSGATEAEAERAMEFASALMLKHNITMDPESDETEVKCGGMSGKDFTDMWHTHLASAAAYLYTCKVIRYVGEGCKFIGRADNIDATEQTWHYLVQQVEALYKSALPKGMSKSDRAEFRRTFKFACAIRVYNRARAVMEQFRNNDAKAIEYTGTRALVLVAAIDVQLKECETFMEKEFPGMKNTRQVRRQAGSGSRAGFEAGDKVNLNRKLG